MGMPSQRQRLCARVVGRVQGVGYREFVLGAAKGLGLVGYVRNEMTDGSVEVLAEGQADALRSLLKRLESGPLLSRVEYVDSTWESCSGAFAEFQIRR